jgi:peptidyl-prolyl cis-trans isomerase B (cyclophilin B)
MRYLLAAGLLATWPSQAVLATVPAVEQVQEKGAVDENEPFSTETVEELARYRAILETTVGPITIELLPEKAPNHVRYFLRLAESGIYNGTAWHRIVPGLMIQTGLVSTRSEPPPDEATKYIRTLEPEPNDTPHVAGTVSMNHRDDTAEASTSFFICTAESRYLDGKATAFGKVVDGMNAVKAIENLPTDGDKPLARINLSRIRIERIPD